MVCCGARRFKSFVTTFGLAVSLGGLTGCGGESSDGQSASLPKVDCAKFQVDKATWRALIDNGGDAPEVTRRGRAQVQGIVQCKTFTGLSPRTVESKIGIVPDSVNQWGNSRDEPVMFWSDGETGIEVNLNDAESRVISVVPLTVEPD